MIRTLLEASYWTLNKTFIEKVKNYFQANNNTTCWISFQRIAILFENASYKEIENFKVFLLLEQHRSAIYTPRCPLMLIVDGEYNSKSLTVFAGLVYAVKSIDHWLELIELNQVKSLQTRLQCNPTLFSVYIIDNSR